jgi:hypothetical protein
MKLATALWLMALSTMANASPSLTFIVAGDKGVQEVRADGTVARVLSKTAAMRPRWAPDRRSIYFLTRGGLIRAITVANGAERTIATLPKSFTICQGAPDYQPGHKFPISQLSPQEDDDFVIDASGDAACLDLKDRNVNMVNVDVALYVDFRNGRVQQQMTMPECGAPKIAECTSPLASPEPTPKPAPFDLDDKGRLVRRDGKKKIVVVSAIGSGDFAPGLVSPSGQWMTITGNEETGDYIHRQLFLLDRMSGKIWPVRKDVKQPLTAAQILDPQREQIDTVDVVGESPIRWLANPELLLVDSLLVTPGKTAVELPGDIAR